MPSVEVHGSCHPAFAPVRDLFAAQLAGDGGAAESGAAVHVVIRGVTVVDLWGGYADEGRTRPWRPDTLCSTYSCAKGWSSLCVHALRGRGLLQIDDPVSRHWPEFAAAGKGGVTVRHLLCHQSGVQCLHLPVYRPAELQDWGRIAGSLAAEPPAWEPGSQTSYHAFTFGHLVGELVRRADPRGRGVDEFFADEIAAPLGIRGDVMLGGVPAQRCADVYWAGPTGEDPYEFKGGEGEFRAEVARLSARVKEGDAKALNRLIAINPQRPCRVVNTPEFRAAVLPASGGAASARGLARLYGALADGGAVDKGVVGRAALMDATDSDWCTMRNQGRRGGGFTLGAYKRRTFGHAGRGGHDAFGDHDEGMGFGYVHNRLTGAPADGERACAYQLGREVYRCLAKYKEFKSLGGGPHL